MISCKTLPSLVLLFLSLHAAAQTRAAPTLADSLTHIAASIDGRLGLAVTRGDAGTTTLVHGHDLFADPLQSRRPQNRHVRHPAASLTAATNDDPDRF